MGVELAPEPAVCVCVYVYVCVFVVFFFKCWCINYSLLLCYISLNWINSELFCFLIFTDNTCVCVCVYSDNIGNLLCEIASFCQ